MRAFALAAVLLASLEAFATTSTSALTGRVISAGAAAAGVTVTATSPSLQGERTTVTTANGRYWLTALPPGKYDVSFSRGGLQTLIKETEVELARVARVDAVLEPSEDEESVTSTARTIGVADTTTITSHFDDQTLDRLPIRRDPFSSAFLAPIPVPGNLANLQDDGFTFGGDTGAHDALEQVTVLRGGLTADYEFSPAVIHSRTRAGGEDFHFSLRDTLTSGIQHLVEAGAGGRIVPQKLWFFAGAWRGNELYAGDRSGFLAKLTAQLGAAHNLMALYDDTSVERGAFDTQTNQATLRYIGAAGPQWTNEVVLSHASYRTVIPTFPEIPTIDHDTLFAKSSYVLGTRFGDHILSAGGQQTNDDYFERSALFANDRWLLQRWTFNLGVRHDDDRFMPRVAASLDLRGDGRHAIVASLSDYAFGLSVARELTLGYATALGNGGSARIDAVRRDFGPVAFESVHFELRYSLFERFQAATNYTWQRHDAAGVSVPDHVANAWISLALPVGGHEFGVTVLERYRSQVSPPFDDELTTDLALRYSLPIRRVGLTLAADVTNVFNQTPTPFVVGRAAGGWVRLRV